MQPDEQWLYLPSLKRVKRISSKNKSGPFVGSEFAYEDITGNEIKKYEWNFITTEKCPILDNECFKLETIPKYKFSGYTKRILWIDVKEFRLDKIDSLTERMLCSKLKHFMIIKNILISSGGQINGSEKNHQTDKSTELLFEKYYFQVGLDDKDFNERALRRIREWKNFFSINKLIFL